LKRLWYKRKGIQLTSYLYAFFFVFISNTRVKKKEKKEKKEKIEDKNLI
jgi:hypothetical protein